jgi:beta-glucosidase
MAPRQLVGFERVSLEPGERRQVTVHVGGRQLSYWSVETDAWVRARGERTVSVGSSSRDTPLEAVIEVSR